VLNLHFSSVLPYNTPLENSKKIKFVWNCSDDINLLVNDINTMKENTETLLGSSRDVGPEINAEKTKYMIMSHHQNSGQNQNIRTANEYFENVAKFKHLG
jgi:hypothetical protein